MYPTHVNVYNFGLIRRANKTIGLTFESNGDNQPVNFMGHTLHSEVWNKERSKKYTDFSITVTDAPNGKLELSLNKAQTTALPDLVYYDLKANTGTEEKHLLTGEISVKEGYTA